MKIAAVEERKKIKTVYNKASASEQTLLLQLYPDIESHTSLRSLAIATFQERIDTFRHLILILLFYLFLKDTFQESLVSVLVHWLVEELYKRLKIYIADSTEIVDDSVGGALLSV
ncbi:hypothetical protein AAVH_11528 [Aphelenchoides avenae]|nr:hypothetical protein AAVH_11528 [Aphelenchus avenae]